MSYGVIYRHEFTDEYDRRKRADVLKKDYTGSITEKTGATHSPLHISIQSQGDDKYTTIKPTEIELKIFSDNFEFEAITEAADKDYQIRVYEAPTEEGDLTLKHIGYVIPEIYSEPYVVEPYPASIRAASMGILNAERYVTDTYGEFYTGTATLMTVITRCLNKLGYELDIWDSTNTYEDRITYQDGSPLKTIKVDQAAFVVEEKGREQALTCMEVLERVLKPFCVNFFMDYGRWVIIPIEHRATQRTVHIYDYQGAFVETGNYNPLAQTFNFLNQDQNLEFMPVVRDIESVFEHGLPNDIVDNHKFNESFNEETKASGKIQWPEDWNLSDSTEFQADIFQSGIREMVAPNESAGPSSVFMNSDLITDGAYIEHTGTETIQAIDDNSVRFKLLYAGQAYERQLAGNVGDAELTIDHKVQIKIGSYYLKADGSWTTSATDITITDLGDQISGYDPNPLDFGQNRGASQFREFQIVSKELEESGTARVRIYKPISEDEGENLGDSFATVAYSMFSVLLYPEGQPPEEATTFFSERDITSYAEEVGYDVHFGDGPTNLHTASYLIDVGGSDLVTASWTRGEYSGGIEDIYINTIFLEYFTKSNLIRGTQKVKGLFDRWFIDYSKGYTVLAGTYDERMCTFNGEMVEILNSEADVWGDPLEAPENFAVEIDEPVIFDPADDDIYYWVDEDGSGDTTYTIEKREAVDVDTENSGATLLASYSLDLGDYSYNVADGNNGVWIGMRRDKKIIFRLENSGGFLILLFDEDLNLLNSTEYNGSLDSFGELPHVAHDADNSIYVHYQGSSSSPKFTARKYDKDLNVVWTSNSYPDGSGSIFHVGVGVTSSYVVAITQDGSNPNYLTLINKTTGAIESETNLGTRTATVDGSYIVNFQDGRFAVLVQNGSGDHLCYMYDAGGTLLNSATILQSTVNLRSPQAVGEVTEDGQMLFPTSDGGFAIINDDFTLDEDSGTELGTSQLGSKIHRRSNSNEYIAYSRRSSNDNVEFTFLDITTPFASDIGKRIESNGSINNYLGFAKAPENWTLTNVLTGTPTITNVVLSASPSTDTVPFTSTITFGADNTGDAGVTLLLTREGVEVDSLTIPANSTGTSTTHDEEFLNPDSYDIEFAGSSITITANGSTVSGGFEGWIDIDSAATDDTDEVQPDATIDVIQVPSTQSDPCGTGGTEFNVEWKLTDYCSILPAGPDKVTVAQAVSGNISSGVTGLGSTYPGLSPSGYPRIRVYSETFGTADNGERVIFGVPSVLEGNGGVFSRYEVFLTGGVDEYIVNENVDILIGGSVFATTSAITALETADSIAQKIYDACVAVGSGVYTFAKNGTRVLVGSTGGAESLDLDIKNAGFEYSTQDIQ